MTPRELAERLIDSPPRVLSELEALTGSLDVDFVGMEGYGAFDRANDSWPNPRSVHPLVPGLTRVAVIFVFDPYHQDPRRPRDVTFSSVTYTLGLPPAELRALLADRGAGRPVTSTRGRPQLEHAAPDGAFFYISTEDRSWLRWEHARPEWAQPRVADEARNAVLARLVDAGKAEATEAGILSRIEGDAASVGAEITSPYVFAPDGRSSGVALAFRPELTVAMVAHAFGWSEPVATSADVHQTSWSMGPREAMRAPPWRPRLGVWVVEATLSGRPRGPWRAELPELEAAGPSPTYDVRASVTGVRTIALSRASD
jgi:hypothetical protein